MQGASIGGNMASAANKSPKPICWKRHKTHK